MDATFRERSEVEKNEGRKSGGSSAKSGLSGSRKGGKCLQGPQGKSFCDVND